MTDSRAIGVFDSGVGGLTVVREIRRRQPLQDILYLADQAHVPYGGRPLQEISGFAHEISRWLAQQHCRAVVMACNISSAVALDDVARGLHPLPVLGMISPLAQRTAEQTVETPIGVLATAGTVASGAYPRILKQHIPGINVVQQACPKFVPLVEAAETRSAQAAAACREYLEPLAEAGCRTIVLGCTHYPLLLPTLCEAAREMGVSMEFIDPAEAVAEELQEIGVCAEGTGRLVLCTTGDPRLFAQQAHRLLDEETSAEHVRWESGVLRRSAEQAP
jgi:glutamate racemase